MLGIYTENEYGRLEWRDRVRKAYIMWRDKPIVEIYHEYYELSGEVGWVFKPLWMNLEMCKISGEYVPIEPIDFNDKKTEYAMKFIPKFVLERTPQYEGRRLYKLLEELGLTYKDLYEILCRTHGICSKDKYYVSRTPDKVIDISNSKIPYDIPDFDARDYGWLKEKVAPDGTPENKTNHWTLDGEVKVKIVKSYVYEDVEVKLVLLSNGKLQVLYGDAVISTHESGTWNNLKKDSDLLMGFLQLEVEAYVGKNQMEQERRFSLYEYYGIETGIIYDPPYGEGNVFESQEEIDKREARKLILGNKKLPKDLAERLLGYKEGNPEYKARTERIMKQFEYYGLDAYCGWDDDIEEETQSIQEMMDISEGMKLVRADQEIPKDLAERLLEYKRKHFVEEHAYIVLRSMAYGYSRVDNEAVILCYDLGDLEERIVFRISETNELVYLEDTMLSIGNKEKAMLIAKRNKKYLLEGLQKWLNNENRVDFDVYKRKDMI